MTNFCLFGFITNGFRTEASFFQKHTAHSLFPASTMDVLLLFILYHFTFNILRFWTLSSTKINWDNINKLKMKISDNCSSSHLQQRCRVLLNICWWVSVVTCSHDEVNVLYFSVMINICWKNTEMPCNLFCYLKIIELSTGSSFSYRYWC